ncbi:hypothetical protein [Kitasatospora sp. MBT66]|uniref:hypothetical protein n=1 Tax=Kitasatospora sp. MBT66 TaxID=1444769 RepID=UPI0005B7A0AA|nr:hypothetical protein [Kitasatospora sp. MBT66]
MGTNSKTSHQPYAVAPTATEVAELPAPAGAASGPPPTGATAELLDMSALGGPVLPPDLQHLVQEKLTSVLEQAAPPAEIGPAPAKGEAAGGELGGGAAGAVDEEEEDEPEEDAPAAEQHVEPQSEGAAIPEAELALELDSAEADAEEEDEPEEAPLWTVPTTPPVGVAAGVPALISGSDLVDSTATLISYNTGSDEPREVLLAHLSEDAEGKLLDALDAGEPKLVPIQVEKEVTGRLGMDEQHKLAELVGLAAKGVNGKLKHGEEMTTKTLSQYQAAQKAVGAVLDNPALTDDEKTMAQYYAGHLATIGERMENPKALPYLEGGKIPMVTPYLHTGMATVTEYVPAPPEEGEDDGLLKATKRSASRIKATIDKSTGTTSWDGETRSKANGIEYAIDLGDGYSAVYRPYAGNDPATTEYSMRGQLEIHAPAGAGHGQDLVGRLEQLHLNNRAMKAPEGELTYLHANITAQGLAKNSGVQQALETAHALEDLQVQELFHERAHEAIGLDATELGAFAKRLQMEAAHKVLPKKVTVLRDAVAKATGFADGAALAASSGYDPTPSRSAGWSSWNRFDVTGAPEQFDAAWKGKSLIHNIGKGSLVDVFATGVLASTERRAVMGIGGGLGMSEGADKKTGGANYAFVRVANTSSAGKAGGRLIWDNPRTLIQRADYYAYDGDHFGALNPHGGHSTHGQTRDPYKIANFTSGSNEVMLRNGADLYSEQAPTRAIASSAAERNAVLALFASRGITHLNGKPVEDVVIYNGK